MNFHGPPIRLALLPDFKEEEWPSMDLCAEMLLKHLGNEADGKLVVQRLCPPYRRSLTRIPFLRRSGTIHNADRFLNRYRFYPRYLRRLVHDFDFFHICDHSYAHLLHALPPGRAGVFCHDLDTFRCLFDPPCEPRPRWFCALMRRVLTGLRKAAVIFCSTESVRSHIVRHEVIDPARVVVVPYGIADEFNVVDNRDIASPRYGNGQPYLLHVGSCIARKRIDVLLDVFAAARSAISELTLVQIGGEWTASQREQIERLGIASCVKQLRGLTRLELANWYRGASLVLQPSSAEGFGLPIIEALACGAAVVASDLPVLREVGGTAINFARVADTAAWSTIVRDLLQNPSSIPPLQSRLQRASQFSWRLQARTIADAYLNLSR